MNVKPWLRLLLLATAVLALAACRKESPSDLQGAVRANDAYLAHFGQPPVPERGKCFARVGFYPLRERPDQVRAVPFFLFEERNQLQLLLERLVGSEAVSPAQSPFFNPFPAGSMVRMGPRSGDTLELELIMKPPPAPERLSSMAAALTETAVQFADIKRVRIMMDGDPLPGMPEGGFGHDGTRIVPPGPPVLLLVVGTWGKGSNDHEEILADFDRPVAIEHFTLKDAAGNRINGDYFTSAFDMAVVVHPENSSSIREGMSLHVEWEVVDRLGRRGEGRGVYTLRRHDHAEGF